MQNEGHFRQSVELYSCKQDVLNNENSRSHTTVTIALQSVYLTPVSFYS
jgi:hypothetical protein